MNRLPRVAIIGMGGFAALHQTSIQRLEAEGKCKLIGSCDPNPNLFTEQMSDWEYSARGIQVFDDYLKMLDACRDKLDVVTIPTPVPFHAPMHKACVDRDLAVFLEKPPTLDYAELDEMIEVEARAIKSTEVGFNFIADPQRQAMKERILSGEFGRMQKVCFKGLWPRYLSYFNRANWAGRLMMDGRLVLDSCMGNAMAHYIHNSLFWAGAGELYSWAQVERVEAELYRAHNIEGTDTVFAKAITPDGLEVQIALSHACQNDQVNPEWIVCDKATIQYTADKGYEVRWNDGRIETGEAGNTNLRPRFAAYLDYLSGQRDRPYTRLIDSKPFVHFCDLVYIASGKISSVPAKYRKPFEVPEQSTSGVAIENIEQIVDKYFETGLFPSQQGVEWGCQGGSANESDLPRLRETISSMLLLSRESDI